MPEQAIFHGFVHPIGGGWTFDDPFEIDFPEGDNWQVFIKGGRFTALLFGKIGPDLTSLVNEVTNVVQGLVDSLGFHLGLALSVELSGGFVSPDQVIFAAQTIWPEAVGRSPNDPLRVDAAVLIPFTKVSIEEPLVRLALADLNLAIRHSDDTAFYSYRAVESIRQWYQLEAPPTEDPKEGWRRLRSALGIEESEMIQLAHLAARRRHGESGASITEAKRLWSIAVARNILRAFVTHIWETS